ncbi:hypothetical protein [Diaphorobacter sp.]|uniref:hypothetical protein n=2 Tax=Diaphorobacter sp. TaxID=1934310 RepID=UPI003D0E1D7E
MLLTAIQEMSMNQETTTHQWLTGQQALARISDKELANALGYQSPNVIQMFKSGQMTVPLTKVPELANALDINPGMLMRRLLQDADPGLLHAVEHCVGPLCLSDGEKKLIAAIRKANPGKEPVPIMFDRNATTERVIEATD